MSASDHFLTNILLNIIVMIIIKFIVIIVHIISGVACCCDGGDELNTRYPSLQVTIMQMITMMPRIIMLLLKWVEDFEMGGCSEDAIAG